MLHGVPTYVKLDQAIVQASKGAVGPSEPRMMAEALDALLDRHPLISLVEVAAVFDPTDVESAADLAKPLLAIGKAQLTYASKVFSQKAVRSSGCQKARSRLLWLCYTRQHF